VTTPDLPAADGPALVEAWRELLARQAATSCALDRELNERHGLGMSEFEVLERLVEATSGDCAASVRIQELAASVHLSQSALSRLVARLEKDGLVQRSMCAEDRRGVSVCLTPGGRDRHTAALPTHRAVLAAMLTG
jgi:DNA-binding MarR family transcriptional regulator